MVVQHRLKQSLQSIKHQHTSLAVFSTKSISHRTILSQCPTPIYAPKLLGADQAVAWHSYKLIHVSAWKFWLPRKCQSVFLLGGQGCKVLTWGIFCVPIPGDFLVDLFAMLRSSHTMKYLPNKRQISSYKGNIFTFQDCADVDMIWYLGQGQKCIHGLQTC